MNVTRKMIAPLALAVSFGAATAVAVLPAGATTAPAKTVSGKVVKVTTASDKFTLKVGLKTDTVYWNAMTKVKLASKTSTISSVKAGVNVTVTYTVVSKTWVASSIAVKVGSTK